MSDEKKSPFSNYPPLAQWGLEQTYGPNGDQEPSPLPPDPPREQRVVRIEQTTPLYGQVAPVAGDDATTIERDPDGSIEELSVDVLEGIVAEFDTNIALIENSEDPFEPFQESTLVGNPFEERLSTKIHTLLGMAGDLKSRVDKLLGRMRNNLSLLPYKEEFEKIDLRLTRQFEALDHARILHEEEHSAFDEKHKQMRDRIIQGANTTLKHLDEVLKSYEKLNTK